MGKLRVAVLFGGKSNEHSISVARELFELDPKGNQKSLGVIDVVMPMLHGPFGEDGTIQGFLELVGVPYVGNGVLGSAAAMDKEFSKALFKAAGIPSPDYAVVTKSDMLNNPESALERIKTLGKLPYFVKPARSGSSVGISKVDSLEKIPEALEEAFKHDEKLVIEVGVVGREIECGVLDALDGGALRVSVAARVYIYLDVPEVLAGIRC